jgi:hypothetical protein
LHAKWLIQPEGVTQLRKILSARILTKHLQHGIARHDVD